MIRFGATAIAVAFQTGSCVVEHRDGPDTMITRCLDPEDARSYAVFRKSFGFWKIKGTPDTYPHREGIRRGRMS